MYGVAREVLTGKGTAELTPEENEEVVLWISGGSGFQVEEVGMGMTCLRENRETREGAGGSCWVV